MYLYVRFPTPIYNSLDAAVYAARLRDVQAALGERIEELRAGETHERTHART